MLDEHEQTKLLAMGEGGCYLLVLKKIAELDTAWRLDPVVVYNEAIRRGFMREDCWLLDSASLLDFLTSKKCTKVAVAIGNTLPVGSKYVVAEFARRTPKGEITHWVLLNSQLEIWYNPLAYSETVKHGIIKSLRVFLLEDK
jgi:hypothetical protein